MAAAVAAASQWNGWRNIFERESAFAPDFAPDPAVGEGLRDAAQ